MNTNHDDSAPRLDPEEEWDLISICINAIDPQIRANGAAGVSALLIPLCYPSVREAVHKHYCDGHTIKFGMEDNPDVPWINLCPKGGLEESVEISISSAEDGTEEVAVKAMAAGA